MAKNYDRTLTQDEFKELVKIGFLLMGVGLVFMGTMTVLVHTEAIRLYPTSVNETTVKDISGRFEFTMRYQTLLVVWLLFNIHATIYKRLTTRAVNPLDSSLEHNVHMVNRILTNSYEQIVLSVLAQLIFITFASAEYVLKVIPLVNLIQFIGRIAFYYGYPFKRAFGFQCTFLPTFVLVVYDIYAFTMYLVK